MNEHNGLPSDFFANLSSRHRETKNCGQCGNEFTTRTGADLCDQCQLYAIHPEMAPKYWTWRRRGSGVWGVTTRWLDNEPLPEPGEQVTVHRKNGSTSVETLREVEGLIYQPDGTARLDCFIEGPHGAGRA